MKHGGRLHRRWTCWDKGCLPVAGRCVRCGRVPGGKGHLSPAAKSVLIVLITLALLAATLAWGAFMDWRLS